MVCLEPYHVLKQLCTPLAVGWSQFSFSKIIQVWPLNAKCLTTDLGGWIGSAVAAFYPSGSTLIVHLSDMSNFDGGLQNAIIPYFVALSGRIADTTIGDDVRVVEILDLARVC